MSKIVLRLDHARKLLRMGYKIIDIKPLKENPQSSVFVFEVSGNFLSDYDRLRESK